MSNKEVNIRPELKLPKGHKYIQSIYESILLMLINDYKTILNQLMSLRHYIHI